MSGPPYPPGPDSGSNAIGLFEIGVSPVGTIPPFNWWSTVLSQYANSPIMMALLETFYECIDQTANFDAFFDYIWNVDTAQGWGLDIWGRIVGVSRVVNLPASTYLGLTNGSQESGEPFDVAPFYSGATLTNNFYLSDSAYRTLILAKAFSNITDGSIQSINKLLMSLFPGLGNAYVVDNEDMSITYTFKFALTSVQLAIVSQSGVLAKPVGISATIDYPH